MSRGHIILTGFMGSGKTTVGRNLCRMTGRKWLDTDRLITEKAGKPVSDIFAEVGEAGFRQMETDMLRELLDTVKEDCIISTGGGIVTTPENIPLLKELGTVFLLKVSPETVLRRLRKATDRPLLQGPDRETKVRTLLDGRADAYAAAADVVIETDPLTVDEICKKVLKNLSF